MISNEVATKVANPMGHILISHTQLMVYIVLGLIAMYVVTRTIIQRFVVGKKYVLVKSHNHLKMKKVVSEEDGMLKTKDKSFYKKEELSFMQLPHVSRPVQVYLYDVSFAEVSIGKYKDAIEAEFTKAMARDGLSFKDKLIVGVAVLSAFASGAVYYQMSKFMELLQ